MKAVPSSQHRPRRRPFGMMAGAVAGALLLSSCSVPAPAMDTAPRVSSAAPEMIAGTPVELQMYYTQSVTWNSCEKTFQCTTVKVPLDYSTPQGKSIDLALIRMAATAQKQGSMLVNPGGPGASGYNMVRDGGKSYFSPKLRGAYDIVGFDPRGVQRSDPVTCTDDAARDQERQESFDLDTDAGLAGYETETKSDIAQCVKNSSTVLPYIDTDSAAKDMDIMRAVLNDKKLNYMGFSYGTKLGATYAGMFPQNVGKFSLDGALDPSLSIEDISMGQATGFEQAIHSWATQCLKDSKCPVSGTPEQAVQQIRDLNATYVDNPQKTKDGRVVTSGEFNNALAFAMYSTDLWELLKSALSAAFQGDSDPILTLADYSADRDASGHYTSNTTFAFSAINCLDYPMITDVAAMRADAAALEKASPTFGKMLGYSGLTCKDWPYPAVSKPARITADGAGPILVIGTTRDPATPFKWAVSLRDQLSSGVLVSWDGDGHTAYGRSNACISTTVDAYFVEGKVPADKTSC
ncbi:alpha/beta hydrolase [Paenarthrobacter sp. PH39-S1]|uniref:alpha/beta hydrolase n=1 Tax=Paenarthrobacter sp. PH39-S1 TaxID=3046204 RepID=UPI0024BA46D7|nr:alpha/beta hydrolase [Paenarthrobacter sp. PH39-S1]MDJ0357915.1 alpha/beta hydrolase [Paenarthrobacter sp. PH39-S1]